MKPIVLALATLLSFNVSAKSPIIEESYLVKNDSTALYDVIRSRPEFIIDHLKGGSFELYGPNGLGKFLKQNGAHFQNLENQSSFVRSTYPTPEEIEKTLKTINKNFPAITKLYSIGKSVKNRDLWVMKLSKNVNVDDARPEFKYIANMHGDEIVGRELMVRFIKELTENYGKDKRITELLDKTQIHILVSMNPDGAAAGTRYNTKGVDLNRDFPDFTTADNMDSTNKRAPETQAVMNWQGQHKFKLSANFHGGAEVVNYPWDTTPQKFDQDELVKDISLEYAHNAPYIAASTQFENGITNGFAWYEVDGGMQDWSIHYRKDLQVTVELSDTKWPDYSTIDYYYEQNRAALIGFIERIHTL